MAKLTAESDHDHRRPSEAMAQELVALDLKGFRRAGADMRSRQVELTGREGAALTGSFAIRTGRRLVSLLPRRPDRV